MSVGSPMRVVAALVVGLFACSQSHGDDTSPPRPADSSFESPIDAPPDTPSCPDDDDDGFEAVWCGGSDCDDSDPRISPSLSECVAPDRVARCVAGMMVEEPCPEEASSCDARTGACAPSACGDGVLHAGEVCDDGNMSEEDVCSATCEDLPCTRSRDCPDERPSCSDHRDDGSVYCRALDDSAVERLGAPCFADEECATGWCDLRQHRCTAACRDDEDCPAEMGWCYAEVFPGCLFGCRGGAECVGGSVCTPGYTRDGFLRTYCAPSAVRSCGSGEMCETNLCDLEPVRCSTVCVGDEDCLVANAAGPFCAPFPVPTGLPAPLAPPDWPVVTFGICAPEE